MLITDLKSKMKIWKKMPTLANKKIDNAWEVNKSKCRNHIKTGAYNMQNDKRIPNLASEWKSENIFPSLEKTVENWLNQAIVDNLSIFDSFVVKKGVRYYPISILRSDLESSHHFAY